MKQITILGSAVIGAVLLVALGGCGDLSLYGTLEGDTGGDFRLSPNTALVPENTAFTFTALGGFLPYDITVAGLSAKDEHTWEFPGQTIAGTSQDFSIEATDLVGNRATAVVTVYKVLSPLVLSDGSVTLTVGDSWTFSVSGGLAPYAWDLDGASRGPGSSYVFTAAVPGLFTLSVTDSVGVSRSAEVTVVAAPPPGSPLTIDPTVASILVDGTMSFTALGGTGSYTFSATGGSFVDPLANPAMYKAPPVPGIYSVSVNDGVETAAAQVTVNSLPAQPLSLSPDAPTVAQVGDTIQFTAAGGVAPYTFRTNKPAYGVIDAATGLYTQVAAMRDGQTVLVKLTDGAGGTQNTHVKWVAP